MAYCALIMKYKGKIRSGVEPMQTPGENSFFVNKLNFNTNQSSKDIEINYVQQAIDKGKINGPAYLALGLLLHI